MSGASGDAPRLLLTAEEAYPAFERAVLDARDRIVMGFRIFDTRTRLRSDAARKVGEDWTDLLIHTLRRGVRVELTLSDFDPIVSPDMHGMTWRSVRQILAIAELAGPDAAPARVRAAMHPARVGRLTALALWPRVAREIDELRETLNDLPPGERQATLRHLPGVASWLRLDEAGRVVRHAGGPYPLHPVSHHQKLAVIDGRLLYIGGLDLNPRRYDTKTHHRPGEETWHDIQMLIAGPEAQAAEDHLLALTDVTEGKAEPTGRVGGLRLTLSRKRPSPLTAFGPRTIRTDILDQIEGEIDRAQSLIYLETQFFRDRRLARRLVKAARRNKDLELLVILPAAPEDVAFKRRRKLDARYGEYLQALCVGEVRRAFGPRAFFAAPAQRRSKSPGPEPGRDTAHGAPLVYVHAKLCVFDSRSVLISSANLNGRSLRWDTEAGIFRDDPDFATHVLGRAMAHWGGKRSFDAGRSAMGQARDWAEDDRLRQPEDRLGFLLPYDARPAKRFGMPLPGVPDEMV